MSIKILIVRASALAIIGVLFTLQIYRKFIYIKTAQPLSNDWAVLKLLYRLLIKGSV